MVGRAGTRGWRGTSGWGRGGKPRRGGCPEAHPSRRDDYIVCASVCGGGSLSVPDGGIPAWRPHMWGVAIWPWCSAAAGGRPRLFRTPQCHTQWGPPVVATERRVRPDVTLFFAWTSSCGAGGGVGGRVRLTGANTARDWMPSTVCSVSRGSWEIRRVDLKVSQLAAGAFVTSLRATNPVPLVESCKPEPAHPA